MFAFTDVVHLFTHKLAGLRTRRLAFFLVLARAFYDLSLWHSLPPGNCGDPGPPQRPQVAWRMPGSSKGAVD